MARTTTLVRLDSALLDAVRAHAAETGATQHRALCDLIRAGLTSAGTQPSVSTRIRRALAELVAIVDEAA